MRKQNAESLIAPAKARLTEVFPQYAELIADTPVYLLTSTDKADKRNKIAEELSAPKRYDLCDTAGMTIVGVERYAVIMFYPDINDYEFTHFLYHEFGHVISIYACRELSDEAQNDYDLKKDTPLCSGQSVWSELIAEAIAYRVEDGPPSAISWDATDRIRKWMDEAVNSGYFQSYPFAFYLAMFFEDPTIIAYLYRHPNAAVGADHCDDEIMPLIEAALCVPRDQLSEDEYWIISRQRLIEFGNCVNDLWDYCAEKQRNKAIEQFKKYLHMDSTQ